MIKQVVPELVREPWKKVPRNTFFLDFFGLFCVKTKRAEKPEGVYR